MLTEPAFGSAFFGRSEILDILQKRLGALKAGYRQNVALTGQMLSGKSSILYQFLHTLKDASLVPVYIEVKEEPFSLFADKFIATILYNYLASLGHNPEKDLPYLLKMSGDLIPRTVASLRSVKTDLARKRYNEAYRRLLEITSILKDETGKSCVVILDEFHNLEYFKIKKPYIHFGKIIMIQKDTMYIVSSSQKNTIKKILSEKLDLLYGNFEIIEIAGFDNKTASNFLREKLQGVTIPQVYIDYLINFTEGNPFYLETISKKIADIAGSRTLAFVDQMIIIETFTALLFNSSGAINQYFTNIIMSLMEKGVRKTYLEILTALASGANKLKDLAKWFDKKSHANFAKILEKLIEEDVIYKNGIFYELQDKVFEFWLKSVYNERKNLLVDEATTRTDNFRNMLKTDIDGYLAESQKTALERIKDLFLLFNGETVEIEKKHRRLPRFVKIEAGKYAKSEELVNCQESDKCWVCDVWKEKIDETAISDFIERSLPLKDKIAKKICIALGGIDGNAVLLAKEKNIWVWNLENLNNLFRLYKRHRLIHT